MFYRFQLQSKNQQLNLLNMKTKLLTIALFGLLVQIPLFAQDRTTVNATSNEISDNLDLRAVASIFGDAKDLEDFERQLNDPRNQISNLDLNYDRQVDYLRVIEAVEKNTHLIILQAVLEKDVFQDVATIEVERDRNNNVQIQVVGDVFMYGPNYIYEPVYVSRPIIYRHFWVNNYHPYHSPYYFNYYPTYYFAWTPYPVYRYKRNVHVHINQYNYYNYSNHRRSTNAVALQLTTRSNGSETRNYVSNSSTRNQLAATNNTPDRTSGIRNMNSTTRNDGVTRNNSATRLEATNSVTRNTNSTTRTVAPIATTKTSNPTRSEVNGNGVTRNFEGTKNNSNGTSTRINSGSTSRQSVSTQTRQINNAPQGTRNTSTSTSNRSENIRSTASGSRTNRNSRD